MLRETFTLKKEDGGIEMVVGAGAKAYQNPPPTPPPAPPATPPATPTPTPTPSPSPSPSPNLPGTKAYQFFPASSSPRDQFSLVAHTLDPEP